MNAVQLVVLLSQLFAHSGEFSWQCVWLVDGIIVNVECKNIHPLCENNLSLYIVKGFAQTAAIRRLVESFDDATNDWTND